MKELIDKLNEKYSELKNTITSQKGLIEELNRTIKSLHQDRAKTDGQLIELNSKWNKMQALIKGVQK